MRGIEASRHQRADLQRVVQPRSVSERVGLQRLTQGSAKLEPVTQTRTPAAPVSESRANVARFFIDLRRVLQVTPHQAAVELVTRIETIEALETGQTALLPPWPETARVVMAYAALAGIDGRPVLAAIAHMLREQQLIEHQAHLAPPPQARHAGVVPVERLLRASNAIAHNAIRLPREAMKQVRQRPDRAFYALSFPLALVLLLLNTSVLQASLGHLPRPILSAAESVKTYFQVQFAPVREGLRWIEVDEPRKRRGDKLPVEHR